MRMKRAKRLAIVGLILLGAAGLIVAVFAYQLGLDNNQQMGRRRVLLAVLSGISFVGAAGLSFSPVVTRLARRAGTWQGFRLVRHAAGWLERRFARLDALAARFASSLPGRILHRHPGWWALSGAGLVILISGWYITSGTLVKWTAYSRYFDRQADAFLAGQLSLKEKPPAELLALADPYDWQERERLSIGNYIWDASLYNGKYYLYWGPVPALFAASVKLAAPVVVEDQYLLYFFICGLSLALAGLLYWLRKFVYPSAPGWTVLLLVLVGGLGTPVFWLVNRPSAYETAIAGGQFFLVLGLLAALRGMAGERRHRGWLVLAGFAWGAAIGCRADTLLAIGWMAGIVCLYLIYQNRGGTQWIGSAACLLLPLAAWGGGLGWYNFARFGSLLETGHRYQLTGPALPNNYHDVFSAGYILPNLYNLLARPLVFHGGQFPFVFAPYITEKMWPSFIRLSPTYYYSEPVAGIFLTIPIFWLVLLPVGGALERAWGWLKEQRPSVSPPVDPLSGWVWAMLGGALLASTGFLSIFIMTTMRYEADLVPLMTGLAALSLWWALDWLKARPNLRRLLQIAVLLLGLAAIATGLLVNFQNGDKRFETNNPALYYAIAHFFNAR